MDYTYRERHGEAIYRFKNGMLPSDFFRRNVAHAPRKTGSHMTQRWREMDSNFRFPNRSAPIFEQAVPSPTIGLTVSRPGTEGSNPSPSSPPAASHLRT